MIIWRKEEKIREWERKDELAYLSPHAFQKEKVRGSLGIWCLRADYCGSRRWDFGLNFEFVSCFCNPHNIIYLNVVTSVFNYLFLKGEEKNPVFSRWTKTAQNGIFRQFWKFIIYLKTKYDKSVLSIMPIHNMGLSQCYCRRTY